MSLLQNYIFRQAMWPLIIALLSLAGLALLTQSLSTLDLVVKNRQAAGTFFWITILALPQLISIILPMAVLLASLFSLNRLNTDSELIVARATGIGPWQIATPILRLACIAAVVHLIFNLFVQPAAFREMRSSLLDIRTDLASRMVLPGEFATPAKNLTIYGQDILPDGTILNVLIEDSRAAGAPVTYVAKTGVLGRSDTSARLTLNNGSIQKLIAPGEMDYVEFSSHQIDLTNVVAEDTVLRLKKSDRYLHELLRPSPADLQRKDEYAAEAHSRLSTPLYTIALAFIALVFLARGKHQRLGYGRKIAAAAALGFVIRLLGFSLAAAAEGQAALNILQYGLPIGVILICLLILVLRRQHHLNSATIPSPIGLVP